MELTNESIAQKRQALTAQLKATQEQLAKLDQLEALASQLFPSNQTITPGTAQSSTISGTGTVTTKKSRILDTVEQVLSDGKRRTSRELISELASRGVEVGGGDPVNNLGAYLSPARERFRSDRKKGGWGLVLQKKVSPNDAGTSKGLFSNGSAEGHQVAG